MDPALLWYSLGLVLSALLSAGVAALAWLRFGVPGAPAFFLGNLGALCYSLGSLVEIHAQTPEVLVVALTVEYLGIATLGPVWLLTAWGVTGTRPRGIPCLTPFLFLLPVGVIFTVASNGAHELFYQGLALTKHGPFTVPVFDRGPIYWVNFVYMNFCLIIGTLTLTRYAWKGGAPLRKAAWTMLAAGFVPWVGMLVYQTGLSPYGLDTAPHGIAVSGVLFAVALFRFRLFDLIPLVTEQVFENMGEGVLVLDLKRRILGFNTAMTRIHRFFTEDKIGWDPDSSQRAAPELAGLFAPEPPKTLEVLGLDDSHRYVFQVNLSPLRNRHWDSVGSILILADITVRVEMTEKMSQLARTDELTGVANRRYFLERLREEADRSRRYNSTFSLAIFDLDHFKKVNDSYGHDIGDAVLKRAVKVWGGCLRRSDLLARYGGEEFALLVPGAGVEEALVLVERMRTVLQFEEEPHQDQRLKVTASCGLAQLGPGEDIHSLIRRADAALYEAKHKGRNQVCLASQE